MLHGTGTCTCTMHSFHAQLPCTASTYSFDAHAQCTCTMHMHHAHALFGLALCSASRLPPSYFLPLILTSHSLLRTLYSCQYSLLLTTLCYCLLPASYSLRLPVGRFARQGPRGTPHLWRTSEPFTPFTTTCRSSSLSYSHLSEPFTVHHDGQRAVC